ncbi:hypothetical protein [Afifella pfennigii]|uniref:hypothetical protein n=1 Tax=Afifella pfennigii TaxID=209897 RepID=UPI00068A6366|nr:hypothetical protein [Afifella pfennigii]
MRQTSPLPSDPAPGVALTTALKRLEALIDEENAALAERREIDLGNINHRKSRALLELTRVARAVPATAIGTDAKGAILRLREKLSRNSELLETNITAVRHVAGIISTTIHEAESDGTYSPRGALTA